MATRIEPKGEDLHGEDFYAWTRGQAALLRDRRFAELDLARLVEEVEDLGESQKRSVRSRIRTIIEHLLKLEHSPAQDPRGGWYDTVIAQRSDLQDELTPAIRREIEPGFAHLYAQARKNAAQSLEKHGEDAAAKALPAASPYTFDQILGDWLP